jgi:hypothetical protein
MTSRKRTPTMLYSQTPRARWLQAALGALDDSLAVLCTRQWQGTLLVPIELPTTQQATRRPR